MKQKLFSWVESIYSSKKTILVIILGATFIKAALLVYLTPCSNPETQLGTISLTAGDTFSYTGAMENYISHGSYYFFNGKENIYAGRMPHYSIIYYLLRMFLGIRASYDLLIVTQLLVEVIAIFYLFQLFNLMTSSKFASVLLFLICILSTNWTTFSIYASPESLSISFLIFFIYQFQKYTQAKSWKNLLMAGLFLSMLVCLKAYYILVFLPIGLYFIWENGNAFRSRLGNVFVKSVIVSLPLFIFLAPWTIRNYILLNHFIPLQINTTAGYNYSNSELAFRKYVSAWGGDFIFWEKKSAGCYFIPKDYLPCEFKMPAHAFTAKYDMPSIQKARDMFVELQKNYSDSLDKKTTNLFLQMVTDYKNEKPFEYYIISPLRLTYKFIVHSGSYYLPIHESNPCYSIWQMPIKLMQSGFYWLSILIGLPGLILLGLKLKNLVMPFIPIYTIILFPIVLKAVEARYIRTVEPLLFLGIVYAALLITKRLQLS